MHYIWDVELCYDSKIVDMDDKFILSNKRSIWDNEELCKLAIKNNCNALFYVKQELINEEICKLAFQQNGYSLRYVKEQTDEICKLAVQQNEYSLKYVKEQTDEICKLDVQQDGDTLKYVKSELMTDEIFKLAKKYYMGW